MGSLNDPVKCYGSSRRIHAVIFGTGMLLTVPKYWLFPLIAAPSLILLIAFDKTILRAWKESKNFQFVVYVEMIVSWTCLFAVAWLPEGGVREAFALLMFFPVLWAMFRTNKELERVVFGEVRLK